MIEHGLVLDVLFLLLISGCTVCSAIDCSYVTKSVMAPLKTRSLSTGIERSMFLSLSSSFPLSLWATVALFSTDPARLCAPTSAQL